MKKFSLLLGLLILTLSSTVTSCKKDKKEDDTPSYYIKFKADGNEKTFDNPTATVMNGMTTITATSGDNQISIVEYGAASTISYKIGQTQYASTTGTVSISLNGDNYEGTFSGTLANTQDSTDTISITDGELKVKKN